MPAKKPGAAPAAENFLPEGPGIAISFTESAHRVLNLASASVEVSREAETERIVFLIPHTLRLRAPALRAVALRLACKKVT